MKIVPTPLEGCVVVEPDVFGDSRGFFMETYRKPRYAEVGLDLEFVQDNYSRSRQGTLRGLHYQLSQPQGKLVQVVQGSVYDVAVDLRKWSPTFGQWFAAELTEDNHRQLYMPPGFAHGFYVQSETADFFYKCTEIYNPVDERVLLWDDSDLKIDWPLQRAPILSEKDRGGTSFSQADIYESPF
ncbi:dTDP-4-dehydrorhamnose 3,5-epimerase [Rubinisphaera margarita]|uniref:dTDP-4-dehydrorhamnose 3,5-epimerase n=1 Tax=Rubinisphaera margarita TaxID=2909586 RepID=UPI001EE8C5C5|nr:dTDP-4-dehydrorhamnose 3,5-epimerase [Rubinisphaera margarita]MCG6155634.1 dTDP-4-dehydrorhamnose 3,5-epimerase [Rubinisphaera margarita]